MNKIDKNFGTDGAYVFSPVERQLITISIKISAILELNNLNILLETENHCRQVE